MKLSSEQKLAVKNISDFIESDNDIFILTGAAGTGKTTVIRHIIDTVNNQVDEVILLAPTNRAAKVLTRKTRYESRTVHSEIYRIEEIKDADGNIVFLKFIPRIRFLETTDIFDDNIEKNTEIEEPVSLFIVDESSMLSPKASKDGDFQSANSLLHDFIAHVRFMNEDNKIIFVGDSYQLPPIGFEGEIPPALNPETLIDLFNANIESFELKEIHRQESGSYILELAEEIKDGIDAGQSDIRLDIYRFRNYDLFLDALAKDFKHNDTEKAIALGWRRIDVLEMNLDLRRKLYHNTPEQVEVGDKIYVNAQWSDGFVNIPKGEIGTIVKLLESPETKGGFKFYKVKIAFTGLNDETFFIQTMILADHLHSDMDFIPRNKFQNLVIERLKANKKYRKSKNKIDDKYLNAIQAKFAYALTVHKAQGGDVIFVL